MENFDILELLPQRPPIVMVDKLISCDDTTTVSQFFISSDNIFCENDIFLEAGIIENIAQTAAARMGYLSKVSGKEPRIGYIGAIKNLCINFLPKGNNLLETVITVSNELMGFTIIQGKIKTNELLVAECEMRIFLLTE